MEYPYLKHPFSLLVCGPSNSGKTYFVKRLIDENMIVPFPPRIIWCYGVYQKLFEQMPNVEFYEGLPSDIHEISNALIIIDDLMSELGDDNKLSKLFTKGSHHKNVSVIFIVQNIFHQGKEMRNISLNASYLCCFKNVRDKQQIACLARQMYPEDSKYFMESYNDAINMPYGYLFLDLKPDVDERLRVRTKIFPKDDRNYVYLPKKYHHSIHHSLTSPHLQPIHPVKKDEDSKRNLMEEEEETKGEPCVPHNGKMYSCNVCSIPFTCLRSLIRHQKSKHNEKNLFCNVCNKIFSRRDALNRHFQNIHNSNQ